MSEQTQITELHKHEVLDRTCLIMENFDGYILFHPYTESDPEIKAKAQQVFDGLYAFYQMLGSKSLE